MVKVNEVDCIVKVGSYAKGGIAIQLYTAYEPYATLTVKLDADGFSDEYAFVDTNNCPWAEELIKEYKLGKPTGMSARSGYCTYPLYKFDLDELEKHKYFPDDYVPHDDDDMPFTLNKAKDIPEAIEGAKDIANIFVRNQKTKYILVQNKFLLEQEKFEPQKVLGVYDSFDEALSHMFNVDYTQYGEVFADDIDYANNIREVVLNDCQYTLNIMEGR